MTEASVLLERLTTLHPKVIDLSLERLERLLAALGNPERALPPVIHVAGSNGKGSTIAAMRAMLEADGKRVHVYTSPHLVRFNERIRLGRPGGGQLVSDAQLVDTLLEIERVNGNQPITYFEATTAAAFLLFSRHEADVCLLEVGLGGRLDATNVIDSPCVSVITPVSIDHVGFLGEDLGGIAREKAGIIKAGRPVVSAVQTDAAQMVIEARAAELAAPLLLGGRDWQVRQEQGRMIFEDAQGLLDLPLPRLPGQHQIDNAGTALAALGAAGMRGSAETLARGLEQMRWPARLQQLHGPLAKLAGTDADVWLDGAHNEAGARALAEALADLDERLPRSLILVVGMLTRKDQYSFLTAFRGLAHSIIAVPVAGHETSWLPEDLSEAAAELGIKATSTADNLATALTMASYRLDPIRVVITGSLYLAGDALKRDDAIPE